MQQPITDDSLRTLSRASYLFISALRFREDHKNREAASLKVERSMKATIVIVAMLLTGNTSAGELRYVVSSTTHGITFNEYALWTDAGWADSCSRAVIGGTRADQQRF